LAQGPKLQSISQSARLRAEEVQGQQSNAMNKYKKVIVSKDTIVKDDDEIRITALGSVYAYVSRAGKVFNDLDKPQVIITATGNALTKAVTAAEVIKRRFKGLHQITKLGIQEIVDKYEPLEEGLDEVTDTRSLPFIEIKLSKETLDTSDKGYQPPIDESEVKEFDPEEMSKPRAPGRGRGAAKGKGKGKTKGAVKGKGKGKGEEDYEDKGKGKGKGKAKGKGKGKGKYEEEEYPPMKGKGKGAVLSKGKSKGKGKDEYPVKGKGKGKPDPYMSDKGKGKGKKAYYDEWDSGNDWYGYGKSKGKGKDKGKGKGKKASWEYY